MKVKRFKFTSFLAVILVMVMSFCSVGASTPLSGDYDSSGVRDSYDAVYLLYNSLYGDEYYPIEQGTDVNQDGVYDSDDAVYLLNNILFGNDEYPLPDTTIPVTFNNNGVLSTYYLKPGEKLPDARSYISDDLIRYEFLGWYDETFTEEYSVVPDSKATVYAKYDGYVGYTFDSGNIYDPNNRGLITAVDDPFGGNGKVLYSPVIYKNDTVTYGYHRGVVPTLHDGTSSFGFAFRKNRTYSVSFKYRFADDSPSDASCNIEVYAVDPAGVYLSGYKTLLSPSWNSSYGDLKYGDGWAECSFTVVNTTDYKNMYIRFKGGSNTVVYDLYIDDLAIYDITPDPSGTIKLVTDGITEKTELKAGDTLPRLESYYDEITSHSFNFDGWYNEDLTVKYTVVDSSVDTYYAKYDALSTFSFETNGIFDPKGRYSAEGNGAQAVWWREADPTGDDNICLRANLSGNGNNTNVCVSTVEGASEGYKLTAGNKYVLTFRYFVDTTQDKAPSFSVRGCAESNIGITGGKTDTLRSTSLNAFGQWVEGVLIFTAPETVESSPYLILMSQLTPKVEHLKVYIDDVVIRSFSADEKISIKTIVNNITLNDNGDINVYNGTYIGAAIPEPEAYYGSEFMGWYNETLTVPYTTVNENGASYWAKNDGSVINFENGGYYDPNGNFGTGNSNFAVIDDPTDTSNKVIKVSLKGDAGNKHFALNRSGYTTDGYKLTVGNTYEISFMYYAEDLNSSGVSVQFRGSKSANIGISGGKSKSYGSLVLKNEKSWTGVTVKFTYSGIDLENETEPYLVMMAQDRAQAQGNSACTATVYFDDIVIKESQPEKVYTQKTVSVGGKTLGTSGSQYNIVVPSSNFSYLARMQCDELIDVLKAITTDSCEFSVVFEDKWVEADNQFNIFVGDVSGHSRDNKYKCDTSSFTEDDYAYTFGVGNIYVDGGSTYALAMAVSELSKTLDNADAGHKFAAGYRISGKYSEKIDGYSTASYYRPTFLEDFDTEEFDTSVWTIYDGDEIKSVTEGKLSKRSAEHTNLVDGCLVIDAAFDDNYYYGGMLKSHGKMSYRYGYLETSCVTPHGAGIWTAMWATPNGGNTGLYRPEVDVNESFGDARYTAFNMHSWLTTAGTDYGLKKYSLDQRSCPEKKADAGEGNTFNDGFHTFGFYWTEDGTKFTVDGRVQYDHQYDPTSKYYHDDLDAFNEKLCLIVSMTVGNPGHSAQFNLDESGEYWNTTNKYIVDYVHIYQIDGQEIYYDGRSNQ